MFNPDDFMQTSLEGEMSTSIPTVPPDTYQGQIFKTPKPEFITTKDGDEKVIWNITWSVLDDKVKKVTGLANPTVRQTLWLDLTDEGGMDLSEGKNVNLGKLREALGQNKAGKKWNPAMLIGGRATITVKHSPNPNDPENPYSNVTAVAVAA